MQNFLRVLVALPLIPFLSVCAQAQVQAPNAKAPNPTEQQAWDDFARRMGDLNAKGDWKTLLDSGVEWQQLHPLDPNGWWTQAWGAHNLGRLDEAITAWKRGNEIGGEQENPLLQTEQKIRANFPTLQLQPLQFVEGDAAEEQRQWQEKGSALLGAQKYDEIEKTAETLQKSNASNTKGTPHLSSFFEGLCDRKSALAQRQSRLAAWRKARPQSNLARIATVQLWTDEAWNIRGGGAASTVTPEMQGQMGEYLDKGFANIKAWPTQVFQSPLAFEAALRWAQLSSASPEFITRTLEQGEKLFPSYLPLYRTHAQFLLPRWFGEPGDMEKLVEEEANRVGGTEGDVWYARLVWSLLYQHGDVWKETALSYDRFKRGMKTLSQRFPNSVSVANVLMRGADLKQDDAVTKAFFASPQGHLIDESLWSAQQRVPLANWRMNYLAK